MDINQGWTDSQKEVTRDILQRVDVISFTFDLSGVNKGCTMNHLDGSDGYITLNDALSNNWKIFDYYTDELLGTYNDIDDIIDNGWKVST